MLVSRVIFGGAAWCILWLPIAGLHACGTSAVGVQECRRIEEARCEAASHCGVVTDVAQCQRFYRDQCLHGLSAGQLNQTQVSHCVSVIQAAGRCKQQSPDATLEQCGPIAVTDPAIVSPCDAIMAPEKLTECQFLVPPPPPPVDAGGGAAGTAGAAGSSGASGAGGTSAGGSSSGR